MSIASNDIVLITRADDMGYTHTGNLATLECLRDGIIRSAAILVIAPWFEEAASMASENPDLSFGVHLGIIGEWKGYRWRPVLPYSEIRTLVDEDGFLWRSPGEFWGHSPDMANSRERSARRLIWPKRKVCTWTISTRTTSCRTTRNFGRCWSASEKVTDYRSPACWGNTNWMASASITLHQKKRNRYLRRSCEPCNRASTC